MIERVEIITADNFVTFENKINTCIIENLGNVRDIKFCINADMIPGRGYSDATCLTMEELNAKTKNVKEI